MTELNLEGAAQALLAGGLVAFPTETVYGLGAAIDQPGALEKIFSVKQRPFFDPLIVHVSSIEQARALTTAWPPAAELLAGRFWPGPLTLVLPKQAQISPLITAGLHTVAVRWPLHPTAQALLERTGPLAAPSANRFGKTSPTTAAHVRQEFLEGVSVLDGGECEGGVESTVVAVHYDGVQVLRPGLITMAELRQTLGPQYRVEPATSAKSPGHLPYHYQPDVELVLFKTKGSRHPDVQPKLQELAAELNRPSRFLELSLPDDARLAARRLYADLRALSARKPALLFVVWTDQNREGIWQAVKDRLYKAATYRIDVST